MNVLNVTDAHLKVVKRVKFMWCIFYHNLKNKRLKKTIISMRNFFFFAIYKEEYSENNLAKKQITEYFSSMSFFTEQNKNKIDP